MSAPTPPPPPPPPPLLTAAATIAAGCLAVTLPVATFNGTLFSLHPSLIALAWAGLAWRGVLAALTARSLDGDARGAALWTHAAWQAGCVGLGGVGAGAVWLNKSRLGKPHYATLHGKLGLATIVLSLATPVLGAPSFRSLGLLARLPTHFHAPLKRAHRAAGALTLAAASAAAFVGVGHPAVASPWLTPLWRGCIGVLVGVGVAAAHAPWARAAEAGVAACLERVGVAGPQGKVF